MIVHGLEQARAAAAAAAGLNRPMRIQSAPGAAGFAGPAWFAELVAAARRAQPDAEIEAVLDCGDSPGAVLAGLRRGIETVRFTGPAAARRKLAAIADASGARLEWCPTRALDLDGEDNPMAAVGAWLSGRRTDPPPRSDDDADRALARRRDRRNLAEVQDAEPGDAEKWE